MHRQQPRKGKNFTKRNSSNPVWFRKSAAGLDILVDDMVIIMLHSVLNVVTQPVFGHQSRALMQRTISISIAPPSVAARKAEICSLMSAGTIVPPLCGCCWEAGIFILCHELKHFQTFGYLHMSTVSWTVKKQLKAVQLQQLRPCITGMRSCIRRCVL